MLGETTVFLSWVALGGQKIQPNLGLDLLLPTTSLGLQMVFVQFITRYTPISKR
jgi:hypothetical protein